MPFYRAYNPFWDYASGFDPVGFGVDRSFGPGDGHPHPPPPFHLFMGDGAPWRRGGFAPHAGHGHHAHGPWAAGAGPGPHGCGRRAGHHGCGPVDNAANTNAAAAGNGQTAAPGADNQTPSNPAENAGANAAGASVDNANAASGSQPTNNTGDDNNPGGHPHCRRGGRRGHCSRQQPAAPFDLMDMLRAFGGQPLADAVDELFEGEDGKQAEASVSSGDNANKAAAADKNNDDDNDNDTTFTPPVDLFDTEAAWVLHVAVPGADKNDVSVDWDAERSLLSISGVVHRPGNEAFLQSLAQAERRVGLFKRTIKLPPPDDAAQSPTPTPTPTTTPATDDSEKEKENERIEVDGDNITARMENGLLVVTVPKAEKEWTEIRTVDVL